MTRIVRPFIFSAPQNVDAPRMWLMTDRPTTTEQASDEGTTCRDTISTFLPLRPFQLSQITTKTKRTNVSSPSPLSSSPRSVKRERNLIMTLLPISTWTGEWVSVALTWVGGEEELSSEWDGKRTVEGRFCFKVINQTMELGMLSTSDGRKSNITTGDWQSMRCVIRVVDRGVGTEWTAWIHEF